MERGRGAFTLLILQSDDNLSRTRFWTHPEAGTNEIWAHHTKQRLFLPGRLFRRCPCHQGTEGKTRSCVYTHTSARPASLTRADRRCSLFLVSWLKPTGYCPYLLRCPGYLTSTCFALFAFRSRQPDRPRCLLCPCGCCWASLHLHSPTQALLALPSLGVRLSLSRSTAVPPPFPPSP